MTARCGCYLVNDDNPSQVQLQVLNPAKIRHDELLLLSPLVTSEWPNKHFAKESISSPITAYCALKYAPCTVLKTREAKKSELSP
jgi:hypothetical protein